jgi:membrane-associated PAP2 superfamily phosphatase
MRDASSAKALLIWWVSLTSLTLLWDVGGLDLAVSSWFGDERGFTLREHALWGRGIYRLQRLLGWSALAVLVWMTLQPRGAWRMLSQAERWTVLMTVLFIVVILIPILKKITTTSCPWDLAQFGGMAKVQWISHWNWTAIDAGNRRCFPAGHASTAFSFLAVPVFLLTASRPWAYRVLFLVTVLGSWMGLTQVYRGAHYVSHSLWTAWISLTVAGLAWWLFQRSKYKHSQRAV